MSKSLSQESDKCKKYEVYKYTVPYDTECWYKKKKAIDIEYYNHIPKVPILFFITSKEVYNSDEYDISNK